MRYYGILRERKTWVKAVLLLLAVCMLLLEIARKQWIYVPMMLQVVLALFFRKEHIVSQEGVDIHSRLFGCSQHSCWTWEEITTIHQDTQKAAPNVMLHFGKDITTRVFVMKAEDARAVLALAKKMNPKIYIAGMGR